MEAEEEEEVMEKERAREEMKGAGETRGGRPGGDQ